ncbi:hypothetical protein CFI00_12425 [Nocardioides sp. S5]|nr:hypothetical protein CFI00_12425 [Nocardioides sp. S5]
MDLVREKRDGDHYVVAVAFEDDTGVQRRGLYGMQRYADGVWRPSGRSMGSVRATSEQDVWMTWGGWGGDTREMSVVGGWVADPSAGVARAIDDMTGRTLDDAVENGVALFVFDGNFGRYARMELLDVSGTPVRTGPLNRRP